MVAVPARVGYNALMQSPFHLQPARPRPPLTVPAGNLLRILACLLLAVPALVPAATRVTLICIDADTGKLTPASMCLTDVEGKVRLPPDGRVLEQPSHTRDYYRGVSHDPGPEWIGPVRKMQGVGNNDDRSFVYEERPSVPWWPEPVSYLVNGRTLVELPEGGWKVAVEHGSEYLPVRETFSTSGQGEKTVTLTLRRWVNLPAQGWWSGDVHVHHPTTHPSHRDFLLASARAADVHMVNVLEMGHHQGTDFHQAGFGPAFRVRDGDYWLVSGQEDPRSDFGHIIGLNLQSMVRDLGTYDFYDVTFDGIHAQPGALVGFAHFAWNGCALPRGFPWYVTTEDLDFVELMQFGLVNSANYYDYLNLGFRLTAAAGSDIPWGSLLGEVRTFVYCGETLTADGWFAGLKAGRTFVSNGPALEFTANGRRPGDVLEPAAGETLTLTARAHSHPAMGELESLMIIGADGYLMETTKLADGQRMELTAELKVAGSGWFTARAKCRNGAQAHTSPVYLVVDGHPTWSSRLGPDIIAEQLRAMAAIETEFAGKNDDRTAGIRERLGKARDVYQARLKRMAQTPADAKTSP